MTTKNEIVKVGRLSINMSGNGLLSLLEVTITSLYLVFASFGIWLILILFIIPLVGLIKLFDVVMRRGI